jgi:hypothetical protein
MYRCFVRYEFLTALFLRCQGVLEGFRGSLDSEDKGTGILRIIANHLPVRTT